MKLSLGYFLKGLKMKLTRALTILGCIVFGILSATTGLDAAAGTLAEAEGPSEQPGVVYDPGRQGPEPLPRAAGDGWGGPGGGPGAPGAYLFCFGPVGPGVASSEILPTGAVLRQTLIREEPNRVEGHYWLALNLCGQADVGSKLLGRRGSCPASWRNSNAPSPWMQPTIKPGPTG